MRYSAPRGAVCGLGATGGAAGDQWKELFRHSLYLNLILERESISMKLNCTASTLLGRNADSVKVIPGDEEYAALGQFCEI